MELSKQLQKLARAVLAIRGVQGFNLPYELLTQLEKIVEDYLQQFVPNTSLTFHETVHREFDPKESHVLLERREAEFEVGNISLSLYLNKKDNYGFLYLYYIISIPWNIISNLVPALPGVDFTQRFLAYLEQTFRPQAKNYQIEIVRFDSLIYPENISYEIDIKIPSKDFDKIRID